MRCRVMGIVNVTPDSFSDGGRYFRPEEAVRRARNQIEEGAAMVDIGGESTRPGATPLSWQDEWARIEPVIVGLRELMGPGRLKGGEVALSVDTYHPETAEKAIANGAIVINCVYAEPAMEMLRFLKNDGISLVLPAQGVDRYPHANDRVDERIYLDPMVGFGASREEDLERLRSIAELSNLGKVLVGASRKRIVKALTGEKVTGKNLGGNLGIAIWCALQGASVVRVHDVRETVQALKVVEMLNHG